MPERPIAAGEGQQAPVAASVGLVHQRVVIHRQHYQLLGFRLRRRTLAAAVSVVYHVRYPCIKASIESSRPYTRSDTRLHIPFQKCVCERT